MSRKQKQKAAGRSARPHSPLGQPPKHHARQSQQRPQRAGRQAPVPPQPGRPPAGKPRTYRPVEPTGGPPKKRNSRYTAQARAKRRKRRMMICYFVLSLMVVSAAVILSLTVLFKIDTIEISGSSRYSQQDILRISGIVKGENLFLANTAGAETALEKKLPYIGQATVKRRFPAKILIDVKDAKPIGGAAIGASYALITTEGKSLELVKQLPEGCPELRGLDLKSAEPGGPIVYKKQEQKKLFQDIAKAIRDNKLDKVTKIDISDPYKLSVVYDNRVTLDLGLSNDLDFKIRFAVSVLNSKGDTGDTLIGPDEKGVLKLSSAREDNRAYFDPGGTLVSSAPSSAPSADPNSSSPTSSAASSASSKS